MTCISCGSKETMNLIKINDVPVFCNVLLSSEQKALDSPKGILDIYFCKHCGHIFNNGFDQSLMKYDEGYDNTLHYSKKFQEFAEQLVDRLIKEYNITGKTVVDIGCGKGDFLQLICTKGKNNGIGFDTSYQEERHDKNNNIRFIKDFYSEKYLSVDADLICCRHVLEHIPKPEIFLLDIAKAAGKKRPIFYFEVPNARYTLKDLGIWDLIYEHVSYFTKESLTHLFNKCGFKVLNIAEGFNNQYLLLEAELSEKTDNTEDIFLLKELVNKFSEEYTTKRNYWDKFMEKNLDKKIIVWGAGSKGITFLNVIDKKRSIKYIVDINPHKHGKYIPGTAAKVLNPEELKSYSPDIIILMNSIYEEEIKNIIKNLGIETSIICA